jgi:hypothetical protein
MGHEAIAKPLLATGKVDLDFKDNENHPHQDYQMLLMPLEQQTKRRLCKALLEPSRHDRDLNDRICTAASSTPHFGLGASHMGFGPGFKESLPNPTHGLRPTARLRGSPMTR